MEFSFNHADRCLSVVHFDFRSETATIPGAVCLSVCLSVSVRAAAGVTAARDVLTRRRRRVQITDVYRQVCRYNWHTAGSLGWPLPMLKYRAGWCPGGPGLNPPTEGLPPNRSYFISRCCDPYTDNNS